MLICSLVILLKWVASAEYIFFDKQISGLILSFPCWDEYDELLDSDEGEWKLKMLNATVRTSSVEIALESKYNVLIQAGGSANSCATITQYIMCLYTPLIYE